MCQGNVPRRDDISAKNWKDKEESRLKKRTQCRVVVSGYLKVKAIKEHQQNTREHQKYCVTVLTCKAECFPHP